MPLRYGALALYLRINPMGKVPAIVDHGAVVTETNAICLYLADRYAYGELAPTIEDPQRGPYVRWVSFATGVLDPVTHAAPAQNALQASDYGWGERASVVATLEQALAEGPYLLGARFSAADVALGGLFAIAMYNRRLPDSSTFTAYDRALHARPAFQRAEDLTWPPSLFGG